MFSQTIENFLDKTIFLATRVFLYSVFAGQLRCDLKACQLKSRFYFVFKSKNNCMERGCRWNNFRFLKASNVN